MEKPKLESRFDIWATCSSCATRAHLRSKARSVYLLLFAATAGIAATVIAVWIVLPLALAGGWVLSRWALELGPASDG
jgi:hypothetical protein